MRLENIGLTKEQVKEKVAAYMIDTYERYDFLAETAKDMYMMDEAGNKYLDFYGGVAVNSAGNCNEKVIEAIVDQAKMSFIHLTIRTRFLRLF